MWSKNSLNLNIEIDPKIAIFLIYGFFQNKEFCSGRRQDHVKTSNNTWSSNIHNFSLCISSCNVWGYSGGRWDHVNMRFWHPLLFLLHKCMSLLGRARIINPTSSISSSYVLIDHTKLLGKETGACWNIQKWRNIRFQHPPFLHCMSWNMF